VIESVGNRLNTSPGIVR